ncbi:MAG: metal-dependent hydrolase [Methanoregula sp.]|nr:metal-dependent hydrolase [Methanoregula sp.]
MNRRTHLIIGGVLFLAYVYVASLLTGLFHHTSGELFFFGILAAAAGSVFPDILEPPTSAKHRGFFHSRRMLKTVAVLFLITASAVLFASGIPRFPLAFSAACFSLGYAGHLAADSLTRAGLPG